MQDDLFNDLLQSLREAGAHLRGETVPGVRVSIVKNRADAADEYHGWTPDDDADADDDVES